MATLLDETLISDTLESLPGWHGDRARLWRDVHLDPEQEAELRRQIAVDAAAMDHAPSFEEGEDGIRIVLQTSEQGGVTELDVVMASHISDLVHRLSQAEPGVDAVRSDEAVAVFRPGESGTGEQAPSQAETEDTPVDEAPLHTRHRGDNTALFEP
ncbi:MAG: 4a-hydroxytetrahydrobiopterin dehydratase [Mycobacteriales bacterium]